MSFLVKRVNAMNALGTVALSVAVVVGLSGVVPVAAQDGDPAAEPRASAGTAIFEEGISFEGASASFQQQLDDAIAELAALREEMGDDMIELNRRVSALEAQRLTTRRIYEEKTRVRDSRKLDLARLRTSIEGHRRDADRLSDVLSDYTREFKARIHCVEDDRYAEVIAAAMDTAAGQSVVSAQAYAVQSKLIEASIDRIDELLGGTSFPGTAINAASKVKHGMYVVVGPAAFFRSDDGLDIGTAEEQVNAIEPVIKAFDNPIDIEATDAVVRDSIGAIPFDPTLGNAHKIAATKQTRIEEIQKGGIVMVPIFLLAGTALLVALYKWVTMLMVHKPSRKKVQALLDGIADGRISDVEAVAGAMRGPTGSMLQSGVEHIREPRELVEEVMYEKVLSTRLRLQKMLPFIAICAASAPLLGLLGTVTGIIKTFEMITLFGSGDAKTLSGGISEALITTKYGLIVAIPSLLLHSFLSRMARGIVDHMEKSAIAFVNQLGKTPLKCDDLDLEEGSSAESSPEQVKNQVRAALDELLVPMLRANLARVTPGDDGIRMKTKRPGAPIAGA